MRTCKGCPGAVERADSYCPLCKAERRRLKALRDGQREAECDADREAKALRVELYAALVAMKLPIFENRRAA